MPSLGRPPGTEQAGKCFYESTHRLQLGLYRRRWFQIRKGLVLVQTLRVDGRAANLWDATRHDVLDDVLDLLPVGRVRYIRHLQNIRRYMSGAEFGLDGRLDPGLEVLGQRPLRELEEEQDPLVRVVVSSLAHGDAVDDVREFVYDAVQFGGAEADTCDAVELALRMVL